MANYRQNLMKMGGAAFGDNKNSVDMGKVAPKSWGDQLKSMGAVKSPEVPEVATRSYIQNAAKAKGMDIQDSDITWKDDTGHVYVKGLDIGKPSRVDDKGVSYIDQSSADSALNNLYSVVGNNVTSNAGTQEQLRGVSVNALAKNNDIQSQAWDASLAQRGDLREFMKNNPLESDYGKTIREDYGGRARNDMRNVAADAGSGANIDSSSLAAMEEAKRVRLAAADDVINNWYKTNIGGMDTNATNYVVDARNAAQIGLDTAAQATSSAQGFNDIRQGNINNQSVVNQINSEISGQIPTDVELQNNQYFHRDDTGNLVLTNPDLDFSNEANKAREAGDTDTERQALMAARFKVTTMPKYASYADKIRSYSSMPTSAINESDKAYNRDVETDEQARQNWMGEQVFTNTAVPMLQKLYEQYANNEITLEEYNARVAEIKKSQMIS